MKAAEVLAGNSWFEACRDIESLFLALPTPPRQKKVGIPYESLIPGMGRQLMFMSEVPRPKVLPPKIALEQLQLATARTVKILDQLPQPAIDALNVSFQPAALKRLKVGMELLSAAAGMAQVVRVRGRPKRNQPREIALVVARHYYGLTERKPTVPKKNGQAYGPFLQLLKDVYEVMGVKASAESQANEISRNWNSLKKKL